MASTNTKASTQKTIDAFNIDSSIGYQIQDFAPVKDEVTPVGNAPSNANLAAYSSVLTATNPQDIVNNYMAVNNEMSLVGQSATSQKLLGQAQAQAQTDAKPSLMTLLADPNASDEDKKRAAAAYYDSSNSMYTPNNILSTKAISDPVAGSNKEEDESRINIGNTIDKMNTEKQVTQNILNNELAKVDPTMQDKILNFGQLALPFTRQYMQAKIAADGSGAPIKTFLKTFVEGVGNGTIDLRQRILNTSPEDRPAMIQSVADAINAHSGIVMSNPNDMFRRQQLQDALGLSGFGSSEAMEQNIMSWIDTGTLGLSALGKGATILKAAQAAKAAKTDAEAFSSFKKAYEANAAADVAGPGAKASSSTTGASQASYASTSREVSIPGTPEATYSNVNRDMVKSRVQPVTVAQNYKDTNPDKARAAFDVVSVDTNGNASLAMYGTDRNDAIANDLLPEVGHADGTVSHKVGDIDAVQQTREALPADLVDFLDHDGLTQYTQAEKAATRAYKVNDFRSAVAMSPRGEMFQIQPGTEMVDDTSTGFRIRGVYGPPNNGYSNASDAMELAKFALRETGIDESNITLLKRVNGKYVPTTPEAEAAAQAPQTFENSRVNVKGQEITLKGSKSGDNRKVEAFNAQGKKVGSVEYVQGSEIDNPDLKVNKENQRQGIATALYDHAEAHGMTFPDADVQTNMRTNAGNAFRNARAAGKGPKVQALPGSGGGDYLIAIDHNYKITPADFRESGGAEALDVKKNFADRFALTDGRQGTVARTVMDIGSMLHPTIVKSALVATDKASGIGKELLSLAHDFAQPWSKLDPNRQRLLLGEINKANETSTAFNFNTLKAAGATNNEIQILKSFQRFHDVAWYLHNQILAKDLSARGFMEFVHTASNTRLPVRPVGRNTVGKTASVYNPQTDLNEHMTAADVDLTYKNGGTLASVRNTFLDANGDPVTHVKVGQSMAGGYMKAITPNTQVLAYRPGYFKTDYKDKHIIMEQERDAKGNVFNEHAVATAPDMKAADLHVSRMNATSNGNTFYRRENRNASIGHAPSDDYDVMQAKGMSAFRRRGKLLEDSNSQVTSLASNHVRSPVETMVNTSMALGKRVALGDVIAAGDSRAVAQYGDLFPTNEYGNPVVPADRRQIKYRGKGTQDNSRIADARTTVEYLNYLRNGGYLNLLDTSAKAAFRGIGDILGEKGISMGERLFTGISNISPTHILKSVPYIAFLALNPIRQFLVQGHQMVMISAINPGWMAGIGQGQLLYTSMRQMGMSATHPIADMLAKTFSTNAQGADKIFRQFKMSGLPSAIDAHNMVSGVLSDVASRMVSGAARNVNLPMKIAKGVLHTARVVGFDAGEFVNSASSWLAHRDLALKSGLNVDDPAVLDDVAGSARNFTGSMNHAGDVPQNQNFLSALFQFTQQSQKMLALSTTNRILKPIDKVKFNFLLLGLFGMPTSIVFGSLMDKMLPDDPKDPSKHDLKVALSQGAEGWLLNQLISKATGEKTELNWSGSLNPYNVTGTADLLHSMFTTDAGSLMAKTPSGSLFFGSNPRIADFLKSAARFSNIIEDFESPTQFSEVATNFAKIASGFSSAFKAAYALEYKKKMSSTGRVTDSNVTSPEALATILGIQTIDEDLNYRVMSDMSNTKKADEDDFNKLYSAAKNHLKSIEPGDNDFDYTVKMYSEANRVFGNSPRYFDWLDKKLKQDMADGDSSMYQSFIRNSDLYKQADFNALIDQAPFKDESDRENVRAIVKFGENYKVEK